MRFSFLAFCLAIVALASTCNFAGAQGASLEERTAARRELYLAKLALRHWWQVEYPRQRRALNAAIELTEQEVRDLQVQLRSYGSFTRFSTGSPFLITLQNLRMCLREAELRLDDLWAERNALVRFHSDDWRALELRVQEARLRVAELESTNVAVAEPAAPPAVN